MTFGKLYATKNMNIVMDMVSCGAKAIYMGDPGSAPKHINFVKAAMLVPDYTMMSLYVDGNINEYLSLYSKSLTRPEANEMFAAIIGCLFNNYNVVMYFPMEVEDLGYPEVLLKHISANFGITAETKSSRFFYDMNFHQLNLRLMYLYNIIDATRYILETDTLDDIVINKIKSEIPPEWGISPNCDNVRFTELIENRKNQIIKYGKVNTVLVSEIL